MVLMTMAALNENLLVWPWARIAGVDVPAGRRRDQPATAVLTPQAAETDTVAPHLERLLAGYRRPSFAANVFDPGS